MTILDVEYLELLHISWQHVTFCPIGLNGLILACLLQ